MEKALKRNQVKDLDIYKITCKNNSNIVWDNDNWKLEVNAESLDRCTVDFTKDTSREGYRIRVTSNM